MNNTLLATLHRPARILLGIAMILTAYTVSSYAMIFVFFGSLFGGVSFGGEALMLLAILPFGVLSALCAPFLIFTSSKPATSRYETGFAFLTIVSGVSFRLSLPERVTDNSSSLAIMVFAALYIFSTAAIIKLLIRRISLRTRTAASAKPVASSPKPTVTSVAISLSLLVVGFFMLFLISPILSMLASLFGYQGPANSESNQFWAQMAIYTIIVIFWAIIGLSLVMILRKLRKATPVNSDSHLIK